MAAETQTAQPASFPSRVFSIPLVSSSLETIQSTITNSPYVQKAYQASSSLASSAYDTANNSPYVQKAYQASSSLASSAYDTASKVTAPVYPKVLPVINAADGYANKGLDTLKTKFPYPFEASAGQVLQDLRKAPVDAKDAAFRTFDERIKTPGYVLARDIDSRLAPLVDLLESVLVKINAAPDHSLVVPESPSSEAEACTSSVDKAQVTRAKDLVVGATDHLVVLTTEQAKALRDQNVYIQRVAERAEAINATLATQYQNASAGISNYKGKGIELGKEAQAKVVALSHSLVAELEKIQSTTATLPAQIQTSLKPLTDKVGSTITDVKAALTSQEEGSVGERASKLGATIKERIGPLVEEGRTLYLTTVEKFLPKKAQAAPTEERTADDSSCGTS